MWRWAAAIAVLSLALATTPGRPRTVPIEEAYSSAVRYLRNADFDQSLAALRSADAAMQRLPDKSWQWRLRLLKAEVLLEQNQNRPAMALLEAGHEDNAEFQVLSRTLKAKYWLRRSGFQEASELLREAGRLAAACKRSNLELEISLVRGQLLGRQRRIAEAEEAFQRARQFALELNDPFRLALALNGLGLVRMLRSRCDEALPLFQEARTLSENLNASFTGAAAANNLGICYVELGDFDQAIAYREEASRLTRPSRRLAEVLGETGILHLYQGEPEKAAGFFRRAAATAEQFSLLPEASRWAGNLTNALVALGDWQGAAAALRTALALKPEPRSRGFLELYRAQIAEGEGRFDEARRQYEALLATSGDDLGVRWESHTGLARLWASAGDAEQANHNFEAAIRIIEGNRADLNQNEFKITFLSRLIRFYQDYVDMRMSQSDPVGALKIADASRARILAERLAREPEIHAASDSQGFQKLARASGSVWLSYWLAPRRSFLWVVTPQEVRSFVLPPAAELADLVESYHGFIERSMRDPLQTESDAGRRLYETLIEPARSLIPAGAHVIILPDGALHQLNFETLPVYGNVPHYWLDDVTVAVAPSFAVFRQPHPRLSAKRNVLLIGDPLSPSPAYPALPHAGAELAAIRKRFSKGMAKVIEGDAARPGSYVHAEPAGYSLIHIAAHAEADQKRPLNSAVILSPGERGYKLYARDVIDVPLRAELVTLSACRTSGSRTYAGEGLVGFAWAFLQAGSRSVIAGLWDVGDASTSLLMDELYAGIAAGRAPVDALREAKLALRKTAYGKPYYWGPFQCYIR